MANKEIKQMMREARKINEELNYQEFRKLIMDWMMKFSNGMIGLGIVLPEKLDDVDSVIKAIENKVNEK